MKLILVMVMLGTVNAQASIRIKVTQNDSSVKEYEATQGKNLDLPGLNWSR